MDEDTARVKEAKHTLKTSQNFSPTKFRKRITELSQPKVSKLKVNSSVEVNAETNSVDPHQEELLNFTREY